MKHSSQGRGRRAQAEAERAQAQAERAQAELVRVRERASRELEQHEALERELQELKAKDRG